MPRARTLFLLAALLLLTPSCDDGTETTQTDTGGADTSSGDTSGTDTGATDTSGTDTGGTDTVTAVDSDSDGIPDDVEGAATELDTDGDTVPDYLDDDSDGDGLSDADEAGPNPNAPLDSDGDSIPDFQDEDSDNNGISDADEGTADTDGDGSPDHLDLDNDNDSTLDGLEIFGQGADCDGDGVTDPLGSPADPADCDGDGTPDYNDVDSDGDTILDRSEGQAVDTDSDGFLDRYDLDSDNDTFTDADEAGDTDPETFPVDTDSDGVADFRDPDADADGIGDLAESELGTDPANADSDGDGVSDLIENAAGTDPMNGDENPRTEGDFVFVIPYLEAATPEDDTLTFRTNFQQADVYFLFDRTRSMKGEIDAMRGAVAGIITNLTCTDYDIACASDLGCSTGQACSLSGSCIDDPAVTGCIPSFNTGTGIYGGSPEIYPIDNLLSPQPDGSITEKAIPFAAGSYGGDEVLFQAAECVADPTRCPEARTKGCAETGVGCPGFREDAARILIQITDEKNEYANDTYTAQTAGEALGAQGIFYVGIDADGTNNTATPEMQGIATAAGSLDSAGNPFVRTGDESAVTTAVTDAITEIIGEVPVRVTIAAEEVEGDAGDALPFLEFLEVNVSGDDLDGDTIVDCEVVSPTEDTDADNRDDAFPSILPGQRVCWDVNPADNDSIPAAVDPQVFILELVVRGDNAVLDKRRVFFLIPPQPAVIPN